MAAPGLLDAKNLLSTCQCVECLKLIKYWEPESVSGFVVSKLRVPASTLCTSSVYLPAPTVATETGLYWGPDRTWNNCNWERTEYQSIPVRILPE